ncbi:MAG: response regulator transcription factor [Armatimonadota bacterium]
MPHVLIADDDPDFVEGLRWYLEAERFQVSVAENGPAALEAFRALKPEIVILDIMMPGMDGIEVCATLRRESEVYILMLSARESEIDKVRALEGGADDYVTKPFHASELVARLRALLRRARRGQQETPSFRWQGLEIFSDEHRVTVHGQTVPLSAMEYELLSALMRRPRTVFSRNQLVDLVWGDEFYGELRLVDNHVYRLREKLVKAGLTNCPIVTIRGVGYAFRPEDAKT